MSLQRGSDMLLKIEREGGFDVLGGLRARTLSLGAGTVEITNADSQGWRELLPCGGTRRMDVAGQGVFLTDAAGARIRSLALSGEQASLQLVLPGAGTFEGRFQVASLDYAGDHKGEASYAVSLASAGVVTFTDEVAA